MQLRGILSEKAALNLLPDSTMPAGGRERMKRCPTDMGQEHEAPTLPTPRIV